MRLRLDSHLCHSSFSLFHSAEPSFSKLDERILINQLKVVCSYKALFISLMYAKFLMVSMSDSELEAIKRKKLRELQRRLLVKKENAEQIDEDHVLASVFKGRAQEVFNAASYQYPNVMPKLKTALVQLALSGKLKEVTGEQLYYFLRKLGLRVRLTTKIRFTEHGKLKSLSEKLKENLRRD